MEHSLVASASSTLAYTVIAASLDQGGIIGIESNLSLTEHYMPESKEA